jgi:hypothetical protein
MHRKRFLAPAVAVALLLVAPAAANDTMAVLKTGGLIFVRSDVVSMKSEDLFISRKEVRVDYVFANRSDKTVEGIVAFPMPEIEANPHAMVSIPRENADNFLGFEVIVDGKPIEPALEQRAFAAGLDVTDELARSGIPLLPHADTIDQAIAGLPQNVKDDWVARGILTIDSYDDGAGMIDHYVPYWTLKSTYWWKMAFPAGKDVKVHHSYEPSVGGTTGLTFLEEGRLRGDQYERYRTKYCFDKGFENAVAAAAKKSPDGYPPLWENWISYVLVTGGNWATTIENFKLTIDKGSPNNLVSFCGKGVKKVGPTTFEMTARDFWPERDLDILILGLFEEEEPAKAGEPG